MQLVDTPGKQRECLRSVAHQEERVRQTTLPRRPRGSPRDLHQPGGVGIHANDQCLWMPPGDVHHGTAIAGTQVNDRARVAPDQLVDLTDVDLK